MRETVIVFFPDNFDSEKILSPLEQMGLGEKIENVRDYFESFDVKLEKRSIVSSIKYLINIIQKREITWRSNESVKKDFLYPIIIFKGDGLIHLNWELRKQIFETTYEILNEMGFVINWDIESTVCFHNITKKIKEIQKGSYL